MAAKTILSESIYAIGYMTVFQEQSGWSRETPVVFLPSFIITHTYHPLHGRPRVVLCSRSGAECAPQGGKKEMI